MTKTIKYIQHTGVDKKMDSSKAIAENIKRCLAFIKIAEEWLEIIFHHINL